MKHLYQHISIDLRNFIAATVVIVLGIICPQNAAANKDYKGFDPTIVDSMHIYLLTCSPHQEVYSLYGHTAIKVSNVQKDIFNCINYGVFNFHKPFFILRFVFGLTDYEMGICWTPFFVQEYSLYGSSITEQEINFTNQEKYKFLKLVEENQKPENRVYRYNYFYNNCTTKARDILVEAIDGKVVFPDEPLKEGTTFREMIHEMNTDHPWARLGNDMLLGIGADRQLTHEQAEFLPHSMMTDADKAYIIDRKGVKRPFVLHKDELLEEGKQPIEKEFPLTPVQCSVIVIALVILGSIIEYRKKKYFWWLDGILMVCQGICAVILTAMIFSQHPTVSLNTQILLFNPLVVLFGIQAVRQYCKGKVHWLWLAEASCICLMFLLYSFGVQWIDMSVRIIALCYLLRIALKFKGIQAA